MVEMRERAETSAKLFEKESGNITLRFFG